MLKQHRMNTGTSGRTKPRPGSVRAPTRPVVARRLLTMGQAAEYLAVSYWSIRSWVESGKLRAVRLPGDGRLIRIEIAELDRLVEECRDS